MKLSLTVLLLALIVSCSPVDNPLLNKEQTAALFEMMISDIEFYDAEMRATRDHTKEVSWEAYKAFHESNWNKSVSPEELEVLFSEFRRGYLNGHSHLVYLYPLEQVNEEYVEYESSIKFGYTYPDIAFYNVSNGNKIVSINNKPIEDIFWNFSNYETTKIRPNGVLEHFSSSFNKRRLRVGGEPPYLIQYEDQRVDTVVYNSVAPSDEDIFLDGIDLSGYEDWETIEKGFKAALLKKDDVALIKIKNFIYMNGFGGEVDCGVPFEEISDSTMCKDIALLENGLRSIKEETDFLIFDLQDNLGGNENTPFVKMFCPAPFSDTRVQYRKSKLLEDPEIREALNYFSPNAENWFRSLQETGIYGQVEYGDFLPERGDFCRGDNECAPTLMNPNNDLTAGFNKIITLTNEGTASSSDDFVFRLKEFGGALVAGQPHSADLTYALISVVYYLDEQGNPDRVFYGNAQEKPDIPGEELFKIDIPYSRTLGTDGNMLQGNPLPMDLMVPITLQNFDNLKKDVLVQAIDHFCR